MTNDQKAILKNALKNFTKAQSDYYFSDIKTDELKSVFEDRWNQLEDLCEFYIGHSLSPTRVITKASNINIDVLITKLNLLRQAAVEGRLDGIITKEESTFFSDDDTTMPPEPFDFLLTA